MTGFRPEWRLWRPLYEDEKPLLVPVRDEARAELFSVRVDGEARRRSSPFPLLLAQSGRRLLFIIRILQRKDGVISTMISQSGTSCQPQTTSELETRQDTSDCHTSLSSLTLLPSSLWLASEFSMHGHILRVSAASLSISQVGQASQSSELHLHSGDRRF
ncbi:hypothetical protein C8R44DRAFT_739428 [Mycena epipterygia]|nr:hypothetical protein C8R44DRAFT_739428 [Mycena epipterygia]